MQIKDLMIGSMVDITLVVVSATARETKAKKPFLQLELTDGTDTIGGNYWDWAGVNMPAKNTVVDMTCQVTEYMDKKQLNIKSIRTNATANLSTFAPKSTHDIDAIYVEALDLASKLQDSFLRELTVSILKDLKEQWLTVPGAKGVHHAFVGGTLVHSLSVAKIALAISQQVPDSNDDLCFVGGLLHDVGKLYTYKLDGVTIGMTDYGMLYDHTFMGAEFVGNYVNNSMTTDNYEYEPCNDKTTLLRHIILSHHGLPEYGAAVPPMCIEAHIVHSADSVDASAQQIIEASQKLSNVKFTDRIYTLANRPQVTPQYISSVMDQVVSNDIV